jgi:hypothetical protein
MFVLIFLKGDFFRFFFFMYVTQHCFICSPSESTMSEDAGMEPENAGIDVGGCWDRSQRILGSRSEDAGIEVRGCWDRGRRMLRSFRRMLESKSEDAGIKVGGCWDLVGGCLDRIGGCWDRSRRILVFSYMYL